MKTIALLNYLYFLGSTRILEGSEIRTVEGGVMNITCEVLIRQSQLQTSSKEKEMLDTKILLVWFHNEKVKNL